MIPVPPQTEEEWRELDRLLEERAKYVTCIDDSVPTEEEMQEIRAELAEMKRARKNVSIREKYKT